MPKITAFRDYKCFKIYINNILHIEILINNFDGVQSWFEGSKKKMYFIEFYKKQGDPIQMGYDEFSNWKTILNLIDENL